MGLNIVCTLKIDRKHDLLPTSFPEGKYKTMKLNLSHHVHQVSSDLS